MTLTTTAVESAGTPVCTVSVQPAPNATASVPRPERVSISRVGSSGVKRLAAELAVAPVKSLVRPAQSSTGAGGDVGAGGAVGGAGTSPTTWNHEDLRPSADLKSLPVMSTDDAVPLTVIVNTRPPHSPLPSRVLTTRPAERADRGPCSLDRIGGNGRGPACARRCQRQRRPRRSPG